MAIDILTSQSDKLLKLSIKLGLLMAVISFVIIIYLIIHSFCQNVQPDWTSIIASQFLVGGVIITVVGIVGLYVGNIFM